MTRTEQWIAFAGMQPNGMHLPGEAGRRDPNALGYADGGATAAAGATGPHGPAGDVVQRAEPGRSA